MKKVIILFFLISSFAFKVEFINKYQTLITPNQKAILITKIFPINYNPKIITQKGIILLNYENADNFVRNTLYLPKNANIKDVNIAIFDIDKIRYQLITNLQKKYNKCNITKIIFLQNNYKKVYFKPTLITLKYKINLDCK